MKKFLLWCAAALWLMIGAAPVIAQTNGQFPQTPWNAYAPGRIECGWLYGANMNSTADQAIPISVPSGIWTIDSIWADEVFPLQPSVSLTTAQGGVYTGAGKTGIAVVASSQAYSTITTNAANTTGNAFALTLTTAGATTAFQGPTQTSAVKSLYFALTTPQGAAATANIRVFCVPLY